MARRGCSPRVTARRRARSRGAAARRGEWLRIRVGEGRKREVRRLFESVGSEVERLVRVRIGTLTLAGLREGEWRRLRRSEVSALSGSRRAVTRTIAIDGPSGAGKSTIGFALADRIDATFVDTGLMYRALTLAALERGIDVDDGERARRAGRRVPDRRRAAARPTRPTGSRPFASTAAT